MYVSFQKMKIKIKNNKNMRYRDVGNPAEDSLFPSPGGEERLLEELGRALALFCATRHILPSSGFLQADVRATRPQSSEASLPPMGLAQDLQSCRMACPWAPGRCPQESPTKSIQSQICFFPTATYLFKGRYNRRTFLY